MEQTAFPIPLGVKLLWLCPMWIIGYVMLLNRIMRVKSALYVPIASIAKDFFGLSRFIFIEAENKSFEIRALTDKMPTVSNLAGKG